MSWTTVCRKDQVEEDAPFPARLEGAEIGIYLLDNEYYAMEDICPHAYALLSEGFVEDGKVECPLHEATFEISTGKCLGGPADRDLKLFPLRIEGDEIQLDASQIKAP